MPSKRTRKPTLKVAESIPATAKSAATQKRPGRQKTPPRPSPKPVDPSSSSPPPSPPQSAQKAVPEPPPPAYIIEYSILFEHTVLKKNTELGGARGSFRPRAYVSISQEIASKHAEEKGLANYLFQNEVSIKPPGGKGDPLSVDWMPDTGFYWAMNIEPIILQIASQAKKGQDSTVYLKIKSVYSRFEGYLPPAGTTAQSTATKSQQVTQEPPGSASETSKTPAKRGRSTTENMLIEARERDKLTASSVTLMPLMKRWKCSLITCHNYQKGGECWVGPDAIHYRIPRHILGSWAKLIQRGQADAEHLPPDLLQDLRPVRTPRGKDKAPVHPIQQPFGYPYITPSAPVYTNPYGWLPPYPGPAAPFHSFPHAYPPFFPPQQQQGTPHAAMGPPSGSSPPQIPPGDPDELVEGYFDWMIKKYPRQEAELRKTARIMLEEAYLMPDLQKWAKNLDENPKLVGVPCKLKERIDKDFKPYLRILEIEQQQPQHRNHNTRIIDLSKNRHDEHGEQEDEEELNTQDYIDIDEL